MSDIKECDWAKEVPLPKTAPVPECSEEDREVLKNWAHSRTMEARLVERARIVLGCLEGKPVSAVADSLNVRPNTVIDWRRRFEAEGIAGLPDRPRSGKPPHIGRSFASKCCQRWKSGRRRDKPCGTDRHWRST